MPRRIDPRYLAQLPPDIRAFYEEGGPGGGASRAGLFAERPSSADPLGPPAPALPAAPVSISLLPPTWLRPPSAKDFHQDTDLSAVPIFTSANTPAVIPGTVYTVPQGFFGVVRSLELSLNNLLPTTDVVWRLRFDEGPVEGWAPLSIFAGNIAAARRSFSPEEMQLQIPEATTVDVEIDVRDGGAYQAGAAYGGWIYSRALEETFRKVWQV